MSLCYWLGRCLYSYVRYANRFFCFLMQIDMSDLVHQCESKIVLRYKWGTDVYNNNAKIAILLCTAKNKKSV